MAVCFKILVSNYFLLGYRNIINDDYLSHNFAKLIYSRSFTAVWLLLLFGRLLAILLCRQSCHLQIGTVFFLSSIYATYFFVFLY